MGVLAAGKPDQSESGHYPPLTTSFNGSRKDDLARRVSFKESSIKNISWDRDLEAPPQNYDQTREGKREARCNMCCAWASLVIGTFMLILLLLGVIFFSFFESNMPDFYLRSLTVNKLQFNTIGNDIFMDSDIEVTLNATNKDTNIEFHYNHMRADIFSGDVFLGRVHLPGLHQKAKNSTVLKVHTMIKRQPMAEADSLKLKTDIESHRLAIDVNLKGIIHYKINGNEITGFPFKVFCDNMAQDDLDQKQLPCNVKMTPVT